MATKSAKARKTVRKSEIEETSNNFILLLVILAFLSLAAYFLVTSVLPADSNVVYAPAATMMPVKTVLNPNVVLNEQNGSSEFGNVMFTEKAGKAVVRITLQNAKGKVQPAHIHAGSCIALGAVTYALNNVVNGVSETTLKVSLAELKEKLPLAINVHKSASEANKYVACGNLELL